MSSEILGVKMQIVSLKRSFENLFREIFFPLPSNSAPSLRLYGYSICRNVHMYCKRVQAGL